MTNKKLATAVSEFQQSVARPEGETRHANALVALLVGIVAGKADLQLNLNIGDVHGLGREWVELITSRVRSGVDAAQH